jgi:hypothetical protein
MPMPRTDIPPGWDERTVLTTFLDYVRATVHAKCEHLAEDDARRAPLSTSPLMTLAGLVNHLRWVEYFWFQVMLLGEEDHGPWTEEDPDREMRIAVAVPIAQLLDEYEAQCGRYRDLVASLDLDTPSKRPVDGRPGDAALDPVPFGRGDRPAQRAPRYPPRAGRRRDRYLTGQRRQDLGDPPLDNGLQLPGTNRTKLHAHPRAKGSETPSR